MMRFNVKRLFSADTPSDLIKIRYKSNLRGSSACIRINGAYTDWFDIRRGVRQGFITLPWLFNLFMDSCLYDLKEYECGLRMDELSVKFLLYADNQVILALLACGIQEMVNKMNTSVKKRSMKVNVCTTKVMVFERGESTTGCGILMEEISKEVNAGNKLNGALIAFMNSKSVSKRARLAVHNRVIIPSLSESRVWQKKNESGINAVEIRWLRSMCGNTRAAPSAARPQPLRAPAGESGSRGITHLGVSARSRPRPRGDTAVRLELDVCDSIYEADAFYARNVRVTVGLLWSRTSAGNGGRHAQPPAQRVEETRTLQTHKSDAARGSCSAIARLNCPAEVCVANNRLHPRLRTCGSVHFLLLV
ncbi:hypothetical protein EVAR_35951_1 [Eumeta japonica]|uniref:Reverse transcriptase domain-containing protein n=1 Tax=Eumeta variegata TaxID=151549 RepID=A0A4C1W3V5_EUMVA|nr:hypothetical protein EVAR_35951_1 [Eumeta japonica]